LAAGKAPGFEISSNGTLLFQGRWCVPEDAELRKKILREAHDTPYSVHPGGDKMYHDLKLQYWWTGMKSDIVSYVSRCLTCQQVKIEHRRPGGLLQPLSIPTWKWESISMDFVTALPKTASGKDTIWVIVDRLTKCAHFVPIKETWSLDKLATAYVGEVVRYHGVPAEIISDRDPRFCSHFWVALQKAMGSELMMSTAYHAATDGQSERTIQTLEDMLRACALNFQSSWEKILPLVEFSYNNSYQASIKMAPFEALYGRKCRSPLCWNQAGEVRELGPEMLQSTIDDVKVIRDRMKAAQDRQKSYADIRRRPLDFEV
jgi:hypothetical protein